MTPRLSDIAIGLFLGLALVLAPAWIEDEGMERKLRALSCVKVGAPMSYETQDGTIVFDAELEAWECGERVFVK